MTVSVRMRRDVVITDPERFLAAARAAYRDLNPGCGEAEAAEAVADVTDALLALIEHTWPDSGSSLWPDWQRPEVGRGAPLPGERSTGRPDGLSPAGWMLKVVTEPQPLQDYGCCGWCIDMHTKEAAAAGESALRINLVAAWRESTVFTEAEQAAFALAEEGTRLADAGQGVSDETWAQVRKHYDDDQIAALVALVALINAANRLAVIVHQKGGSYEPGMFAA